MTTFYLYDDYMSGEYKGVQGLDDLYLSNLHRWNPDEPTQGCDIVVEIEYTGHGDYVGSTVERANYEYLLEEYADLVGTVIWPTYGGYGSKGIVVDYNVWRLSQYRGRYNNAVIDAITEITEDWYRDQDNMIVSVTIDSDNPIVLSGDQLSETYIWTIANLFDDLQRLQDYAVIDTELMTEIEHDILREDLKSWIVGDYKSALVDAMYGEIEIDLELFEDLDTRLSNWMGYYEIESLMADAFVLVETIEDIPDSAIAAYVQHIIAQCDIEVIYEGANSCYVDIDKIVKHTDLNHLLYVGRFHSNDGYRVFRRIESGELDRLVSEDQLALM